MLLQGGLREWPPLSSASLYKKGLATFQRLPLSNSNFWGILIGLLVVFRDKGLGVPSIALFLDLFSVKEASEGFLYLSKRSSALLIISDLPSSYKFWKERYFFCY